MSDRDDIDPELKETLAMLKQRDRQITMLQASIERAAEAAKAHLYILQQIGHDGIDAAARVHGAKLVFTLAEQACLYTYASLEAADMRSKLDLVRSFLESPPPETDETPPGAE